MKRYAFRFAEDSLQQRLLKVLAQRGIVHEIAKDGTVRYSVDVAQTIENDCIGEVRDTVFTAWQVLSCPSEWAERYERYMTNRGIPYRIEYGDGERTFLLPLQYRPHRWKLETPAELKLETPARTKRVAV